MSSQKRRDSFVLVCWFVACKEILLVSIRGDHRGSRLSFRPVPRIHFIDKSALVQFFHKAVVHQLFNF